MLNFIIIKGTETKLNYINPHPKKDLLVICKYWQTQAYDK